MYGTQLITSKSELVTLRLVDMLLKLCINKMT
jgi:hypothetical protein